MFTMCFMNEMVLLGNFGSAPIGSSGSRQSGYAKHFKLAAFPFASSQGSEVWFVLSQQASNHALQRTRPKRRAAERER
jgi:hypothetical protein